jgi:bacillolysin
MTRLSPSRQRVILGAFAVLLPGLHLFGQDLVRPKATALRAVSRMAAARGGEIDARYSRSTGLVVFMTTGPGAGVPVPDKTAASPEARAESFLRTYGAAFGFGPPSEPRVTRVSPADAMGVQHVRLQQLVGGVPVVAGELMVHLRGTEVVAANGEVLENPALDTAPTVGPERALEAVREVARKRLGADRVDLSVPELQVLNRGLLEGGRWPTHLTWFVVATNESLREYVWVDAHRGGVVLHFNQRPNAKYRTVYDAAHGSTLPGTLMRVEGGAATGDADVDDAYRYAGDTYDYYWSEHGRDSFDGAGAEIRSSVRYCDPSDTCPMQNAFWNGTQMAYGDGFPVADDVVAHELTHAVTERTASLFYYMQSGALNESFSDIFGETVDLGNGSGTDTPAVRWLMGEDIPGIGAIRNMMDPTAFANPGKMSDTAYFACGGATGNSDGGGVHTNSGVPNHAYALMVDGGSYNSQAVAGIGLTKAGKIEYRALTAYLLSGSDFLDDYYALKQSCTDLVGTAGITAADCVEVGKALDAVQLSQVWPCTPVQAAMPALCPAGQDVLTEWSDDFENTTSGGWTTTLLSGTYNHWNVTVTGWRAGTGDSNLYFDAFAAGGAHHLWAYDHAYSGNSTVQMASGITLPVGARLQFNHSFGFDQYNGTAYDGGVVEYCTGACSTWTDAGSLISAGATYNGTLPSTYGNPLGGRSAFTKASWGYTASQLDLGALAGQTARFRFRIGTDSSVDDYGWFIDDVRIYRCVASTCTFSIDPTSAAYPPAGGTGSVTVTTQAGCSWTAASNDSWITVTSGQSGTGGGTVGYSVATNYGPTRAGTVTIAGQTFTVTQEASSCSYSIDPTSASAAVGGGTGSVAVTGDAGCLWSAVSHDAWITVTSGASGSGNGSVGYSVAANTGAPRTGTITIAWQTFTVTQTGVQFTDIGASLQGLGGSAVAWGDYDNDGDLDVLVTGCSQTGAGDCWILNGKVYRNDGGGAFTLVANPTGVTSGSVAWGDYDRDGDLDFALSGCDWTGIYGCYRSVTKVYRNDGGGTFTDIAAGLPATSYRTLAWGDYDDDGDLDLLAGATLFRNDGGGVFTNVWTGSGARSAWGDYDNDGDLDILMISAGSPYASTIYRNDGGGVFTDAAAGLAGVGGGFVAWGDYDNDGDLDVLLSGSTSSTPVSKVYRNDGAGGFTDVWTGPSGAAAWGDYDNDGDLDILALSSVYRNDGGASFVDAGEALPSGASTATSVAWGDYDNDGDLDILLSGSLLTRIYSNGGTTANTAPSAPTGLGAEGRRLSWTASTDAQTPAAGLTYNVRVGTTPGGVDVVPPMASTATGYRRVAQMGNQNLGTTASLTGLGPGTYYWAVQAVDSAFAGSPFSAESSFQVCDTTLSPSSVALGAGGGSGTVTVTVTGTCAWTATSTAPWIHVTSGESGSGSGVVGYTVDANTGIARTGSITIAGLTFTVDQASGCTWTLDPTGASYGSAGGSGNVGVTAGTGCAWTAASNDTWITVTGGSSGSGNGTVSYGVAPSATPARTGTMTIGGQTFTVEQASGCTYALDPTSASFGSDGGSGTVAVTAGTGCAWTAASHDSWITVTGGSSGSGNGTVSYGVAPSATPARTGTMTIGGQTFTVEQASGCTYALDPTSASFGIEGGDGTVGVATGAGCPWTAVSNMAWITVTGGSSGLGDGTVSYTVAANAGPRTGTMTIGGQTFTVNQGSRVGFYTVTPCRVFDTRQAVFGPALGAGETRPVTIVGGPCGIPAEASAVSFNVTVAGPSAQGHLRLYPAGESRPGISTINYVPGQNRANNGVVVLGTSGQIAVYCNQARGSADVIIDVNGYFVEQ